MQMRCLQPPEGAAATAAARHCAPLPRLETARLLLRAPVLADCATWAEIWSGPDQATPMTPERAWEEFCVYVAGWLLHGHGLWAVERKADRVLVGFVLLGLEWEDAEPEIGWGLTAAHRGRGYATEAAAAVRAHALALLGDGRVVSCVDANNAASAAVAQRIGGVRDAAASAAADCDIFRHGRSAA